MVKKSYSTNRILCETFSYGNQCDNDYFLWYWDKVYDGEGDIHEYKKKLVEAENFGGCVVEYFIKYYFKTELLPEYILNEPKSGIKWNKLFLDVKLPKELISAIRTLHYFAKNLSFSQHLKIINNHEKD